MSEELEKAFDDCKYNCIESRNEPDKIDCYISSLKKKVLLEIAKSISEAYTTGHEDGENHAKSN